MPIANAVVFTELKLMLDRYSTDPEIRAAMLSGMSKASAFLAKMDGSRDMTAQRLLSLVNEYATQYEGMDAQR